LTLARPVPTIAGLCLRAQVPGIQPAILGFRINGPLFYEGGP
jgi:hypothetical protein